MIIRVINDYAIVSKLGYIVMDNATNNDTLVVLLLERIDPYSY